MHEKVHLGGLQKITVAPVAVFDCNERKTGTLRGLTVNAARQAESVYATSTAL